MAGIPYSKHKPRDDIRLTVQPAYSFYGLNYENGITGGHSGVEQAALIEPAVVLSFSIC